MQVTLKVPEGIAQCLEIFVEGRAAARARSLAMKGYRSGTLTAAQLRRLLGFNTRMQVDAFLNEHEICDYTVADFEENRQTPGNLRAGEPQHRS